MHGEGSPVFSPSALVPTFPTATCHHHTQQLARSPSQKSQPCPRRCSPGSLGRGDAPGARTVSPACQHLPGGWWRGVPGGGPGRGTGGGQVEGGRPSHQAGQVAWAPASRQGGGGIHLCKQSLDGEASLGSSATVRTPGPSELTGTTGVALQQPDDGGVALGTFNEFFQGQFACGAGERRNGGQPGLRTLHASRGPGHRSHTRGRPLWSKSRTFQSWAKVGLR